LTQRDADVTCIPGQGGSTGDKSELLYEVWTFFIYGGSAVEIAKSNLCKDSFFPFRKKDERFYLKRVKLSENQPRAPF
jgi:hypothetical protein